MIQRIQSLFLLLAGLLAGGALFFPQATVETNQASGILADGSLDSQDNIALLILPAAAGLLALIAIFLFRNRKLQMSMTILYLLIVLAAIALAVFLLVQANGTEWTGILPGPGFFLILGGIVFVILARFYIRKDDKLVRSMDRLR